MGQMDIKPKLLVFRGTTVFEFIEFENGKYIMRYKDPCEYGMFSLPELNEEFAKEQFYFLAGTVAIPQDEKNRRTNK